ncbi:BgTH12-01947 [Blumeria graminis f. sp. triticale]|uniref:BgTH12-01947 n=1 Tax=Blumeria graminis f. sp. triticale TaxID=1689686 RepID=A0A9W4GDM9_BLUGR|nr:BgTH12-01947 [Blumeria graminis f. sp. triticale]
MDSAEDWQHNQVQFEKETLA